MDRKKGLGLVLALAPAGVLWSLLGTRIFTARDLQTFLSLCAVGVLLGVWLNMAGGLAWNAPLPPFDGRAAAGLLGAAFLFGPCGFVLWKAGFTRLLNALPYRFYFSLLWEEGVFWAPFLGTAFLLSLLGRRDREEESVPLPARLGLAAALAVVGCVAGALCRYIGGPLRLGGAALYGVLPGAIAALLPPARPLAPERQGSGWLAVGAAGLVLFCGAVFGPGLVRYIQTTPIQPPQPQQVSAAPQFYQNSEVPVEAQAARALLDAYLEEQNSGRAADDPDRLLGIQLGFYSIESSEKDRCTVAVSVTVSVQDPFREETLYGKPEFSGGSLPVVWRLEMGRQGELWTLRSITALRREAAVDYAFYQPTFHPEYDYYLDGEKIVILADYGNRRIDTPLTRSDVERTADGNTDGRGILPGSYQLREGMYAFTAGGPFSARVVYSTDGGESWRTSADLPFEAGVRARFVSFYSETGGWLAVGGGRLMGSEGYLLARTQDGGQSWQRVELPPELAFSHLMDGIAFADESRGFLSFDVMDREPDYWYTGDGGATFTQVELPMPQELLNTFYKVDSLAFDPVTGQGQLVVGQGPYGGKKAVFTSEDGGLHWAFEEMREESGHYVG